MFSNAFAGSLPPQGSIMAPRWDSLWDFVVYMSIFFFVLVIGAMVYFIRKYRASSGARPKYITGSHVLEIAWTLVPALILLGIFAWGYAVYNGMTQAPADAYEVRVIGKQWLWTFQYDDGRTTIGEVYVPVHKPVKFVMTSEDVLHSFFIPNFRVKQDVVPGMYTSVWFEATVPGRHQVFCAEYCGTSHSQMLAAVVALGPTEFDAWKRGKKPGEQPAVGVGGIKLTAAEAGDVKGGPAAASQLGGLAAEGQQLTQTKGCVACHTTDGSVRIGPSWKGVYDHDVELEDGSKAKADENYIRESIENPQAKIVKGFKQVVMPPYKGQLSETELNAIIAYIKSLK
jgi:cytochrome c oxidase subunit 2